MGIMYILTIILLGIAFMIFKKSDQKLNFIKWIVIYFVSLFGYNVTLGMILGLLNITSHIWLLSIINIIFAILLSFKAIIKKDIQKYYVKKIEVLSLLVVFVLFGVMFVKDLYITDGNISHGAIDSAIHYRAAKHYAESLKIFINVEDKTFFNFNVMQTGAYINDGIFMNVINEITGLDYTYLYQVFETIVLFLSGLAFYVSFFDKIKTKKGFVLSLMLFALYMYGYPYNSWIYGFSYLSVGIMIIAILIPVVEYLYSEEKVSRKLLIPLIVILSIGLIFSYCLFVPAIFVAICIYCFLKDFSEEGKTYFKFFKKTTLLITGLLLLVTVAGIGYLLVPTFFIEGQTNLFDALKLDGAIYSEKYANFIPYLPFAVIYFAELIDKIKNRKLKYMDVFSVVVMGYFACLYLGLLAGFASKYYMLKIYFILWMVIFSVTIDLINKYGDEKLFRIDGLLIFALFVLLIFKQTRLITISKLYIVILLALFTVLPQLLTHIDFKKISEKLKNGKIKKFFEKIGKIDIKTFYVSGNLYIFLWAIFVCTWVLFKAGGVIGETEKHSLPNLVGIYYHENCEFRKLIDLTQDFNKNEIELALYARDNLKDLNADNVELITVEYYTRTWATAVLEIDSDKMPYQNFIQDSRIYTVKDALENESKDYVIQMVSYDAGQLEEYNKNLEKIKKLDEIEILFENENGFVAKINR